MKETWVSRGRVDAFHSRSFNFAHLERNDRTIEARIYFADATNNCLTTAGHAVLPIENCAEHLLSKLFASLCAYFESADEHLTADKHFNWHLKIFTLRWFAKNHPEDAACLKYQHAQYFEDNWRFHQLSSMSANHMYGVRAGYGVIYGFMEDYLVAIVRNGLRTHKLNNDDVGIDRFTNVEREQVKLVVFNIQSPKISSVVYARWRRHTHFFENSADRLYLLLKRAEFLQHLH